MAPDGRCKFGDARANGYVRSEGAGIVVLKPLSKALTDGDPIYAVIRGSAVNNDGRTSGYMTTPSRAGQEKLLRLAYRDAGLSPSEVRYVEAHGTGKHLIFLIMIITDTRIKVPPLVISLRLRASTKFSSHLMDLKTLSLLALLNLVLATPKPCRAWLV